jgi:predicted outer membrane repeat protein
MLSSLRPWSRPAAGLCGAALAALVAGAMSATAVDAATANVVFCPRLHCSASRIQDAINSAPSGSTIAVGAGTYLGDITIGKSVTLQAYGPVTIDGQNSASNPGSVVVNISSATMNAFTITGGYANTNAYWGGGIANYGTLTVRNSVITGNNGAGDEGGGIFNSGQLIVGDTTITGNTSQDGGGIGNYGTLVMRGSRVTGNSAVHNGGGLNNAYGSGAMISGTVFSGNSSEDQYGGGIYNDQSTLTVDGSVIVRNSAVDGGGIYNTPGNSPASAVSLRFDVIELNTPNNCGGDASC